MLTRTLPAAALEETVAFLDAAAGQPIDGEKAICVAVLHDEDLAEAVAVSLTREQEVMVVEQRRANVMRILSCLIRRVQERTLEPVLVTQDELNDILGWELKMEPHKTQKNLFVLEVEPPKDRIVKPRLIT